MAALGSPAPPTVLFVEDDDDVRFLLEMVAARSGLNALGACDAQEGLDLARGSMPDLISVDIGLPDLDGIELCRRLREFYPGPVLVISAWAHDQKGLDALSAGADQVIAKPFDPQQLTEVLRSAVGWPAA